MSSLTERVGVETCGEGAGITGCSWRFLRHVNDGKEVVFALGRTLELDSESGRDIHSHLVQIK